LRVLIWMLLGGVLYWVLRGWTRGGSPGPRDKGGNGEEMVRDPQCGVYVPVSSALKRRVKGQTVYFCSRECEVSYKKNGN